MDEITYRIAALVKIWESYYALLSRGGCASKDFKISSLLIGSLEHWLGWQGSKGIGQWPINWYTFPMRIHKITPSVDLQLVVETLGYSILTKQSKSPKVVKQTNKKTFL